MFGLPLFLLSLTLPSNIAFSEPVVYLQDALFCSLSFTLVEKPALTIALCLGEKWLTDEKRSQLLEFFLVWMVFPLCERSFSAGNMGTILCSNIRLFPGTLNRGYGSTVSHINFSRGPSMQKVLGHRAKASGLFTQQEQSYPRHRPLSGPGLLFPFQPSQSTERRANVLSGRYPSLHRRHFWTSGQWRTIGLLKDLLLLEVRRIPAVGAAAPPPPPASLECPWGCGCQKEPRHLPTTALPVTKNGSLIGFCFIGKEERLCKPASIQQQYLPLALVCCLVCLFQFLCQPNMAFEFFTLLTGNIPWDCAVGRIIISGRISLPFHPDEYIITLLFTCHSKLVNSYIFPKNKNENGNCMGAAESGG